MTAGEKYQLRLLGPFGLFTPAGARIEISSKKAVALFGLLASAPSGLRTRTWLQTMLWETRDTPQAQASLRRELSTISKVLDGHGAAHLVIKESQRVRLNLDVISVDLLNLEIGAPEMRNQNLGDYLEGLDLADCNEFEHWLRAQRERASALLELVIPQPASSEVASNPILSDTATSPASLIKGAPPRIPPKPSVVVVPFNILSQENTGPNWLGVGIAEEISMTLSQFPQLFVVASGSAALLAERGFTHREIAHQLGIQYLLTGRIQCLGEKLRVAVSLIDGHTEEQVWGQNVDGRFDDLFSLQDKVAVLAAPQIWTQIDLAERARIRTRSDRGRSNYELYWRANALFRDWTKESIIEAIALSEELVAKDPDCPFGTSLAGFCNGVAFGLRLTRDPEAKRRAAIAHYQNALRHGAENVEAIGYVAGTLVSINGDMPLADRLINHALSIMPSYQPTLFWGGWVDLAMGNPARARERMELSLRINPTSGSRPYALAAIGITFLFQGEHSTAIEFLREATSQIPTYPPAQAALFAAAEIAGRKDISREATEALRDMNLEAALSIFNNPEQKQLFMNALKSRLN